MNDSFEGLIKKLDSFPLEHIRDYYVENDIISYTEQYLNSMNIVNHRMIMPLYFSSIGAHVLNLLNTPFCATSVIRDKVNQWDEGWRANSNSKPPSQLEREKIILKAGKFSFCPFYSDVAKGCSRVGLEVESPGFIQQFGQIPDLRVHTAYIAPPGFSKNFFMDFFLSPDNGFLNFGKYGEIPATKITTMTEASYIASKDEKRNITYGYAKSYCAGILALPEFYSVTLEGQMQHSLQMETMLLEALEKGEIMKGLAGTPIKFFTHHTLWAATQPGKRFDVSSGLGRRLNFVQYLPTKEEQEEYKDAQEKGYGREANPDIIANIRGYLYKVWKQKYVQDIVFSDSYLEKRKIWLKTAIRHTDIKLIDNVAMGYNFITTFKEMEPILEVKVDKRLSELIERLLKDRKVISTEGGTEMDLMLSHIGDNIISFYSLVREYSDNLLLSYDIAKSRLLMAIAENRVGSFKERSPVTNTEVTYIYSINSYPTETMARTAVDMRRGEPKSKK